MKSRRGRNVGILSRLICLAALGFTSCAPNDNSRDPALQYIPRGSVTVDVMHLVAPPRLTTLSETFQKSVQSHGDWFRQYMNMTPPGAPLPYHPNMGLSEAEYKEMLQLTDTLNLVSGAKATLQVKKGRGGVLELDGGKDLPELTGITIDLKYDEVTTPFGVATDRDSIIATSEQSATGPWNGVSWSGGQLNADKTEGFSIQFNVGRFVNGGRGILYYDAKKVTGTDVKKASRVLTYDLPPATPGS